MKFVISIILLSLFVYAFAKKSFGHKTHKEKIYGNNDDLNERQLAKEEYYRNKHFDHLKREHFGQLVKQSPIAVSEDDIRLQADVIDDRRRTHHNSDPDLKLQHIGKQEGNERKTEHKKHESSKRIDDQKERHDKHNAHKKHELSGKDNEHKHKKYRNEDKTKEVDRVYGTQHLSADYEKGKHEKHQKNWKKDKHHKKNKKDMSKKYKKSYSNYY
jgi:hypothetical protein